MELVLGTENWKTYLPKRKADSFKGSYGKVFVAAGSKNMSGAAYFAAKAAYRTGAGLVYIYTQECNRVILQQLLPEAVLLTWTEDQFDRIALRTTLKEMDAIVAGPGFGCGECQCQILKEILCANEKKRILDADALNLLAQHPDLWEVLKKPLIITPHLGEMSRLSKKNILELKQDLLGNAEAFSQTHPVITVLKDARTVVTNGIDHYRNQTGNHGMATGGSGDVLSGIIGGLLAQNSSLFEAAALGVYLHGMAGDAAMKKRGAYSMMASDIVEEILFQIS